MIAFRNQPCNSGVTLAQVEAAGKFIQACEDWGWEEDIPVVGRMMENIRAQTAFDVEVNTAAHLKQLLVETGRGLVRLEKQTGYVQPSWGEVEEIRVWAERRD